MREVAPDRAVDVFTVENSLSVVPADQGHAIGLHRIVELAYAQEGASWSSKPAFPAENISPADISRLIDAPKSQLLVAIRNDAVVGCVLVSRLPARRSALGLLGVDPALRKAGLGTRLIAEAEALAARKFGANTIELCVLVDRKRLVSYYQDHGFALTGEWRSFPDRPRGPEFAVMDKTLRA